MNHRQRGTLHGLFAHPVSSDIDPGHAVSVLEPIGAEVTYGGRGQMVIKRNGHTHGFRGSRHGFLKEDVATPRKFLEAVGIDPARHSPIEVATA